MSEPWFRRYAGFGYRPITWQGRAVITAMLGVFLPAGLAWLYYADTRPTLALAAIALAVSAAVIGHAVVVWKID
jgi:hypothetical protein